MFVSSGIAGRSSAPLVPTYDVTTRRRLYAACSATAGASEFVRIRANKVATPRTIVATSAGA